MYDKKKNLLNGLYATHRRLLQIICRCTPMRNCPFPIRYSSISAVLYKPLSFFFFAFETFPPNRPPSCISCHSNGIFSYQPAYQIQISVMDKSAWADGPECRLLLSISVLPGDCVLLGCMTLWGPFGGPAELEWLQSLKVNFGHWSPFRNRWDPVKVHELWGLQPFLLLIPRKKLSTYPKCPSTSAHMDVLPSDYWEKVI